MTEDKLPPIDRKAVGAALGRVPSGLFILTARHEDNRGGMLASWVQQCSFEPPMVSVAVSKGRAIMPLISESRQFALCQVAHGEKVLLRKFASAVDPGEDPFLGFELVHDTVLGLPILAGSLAFLECSLTCHMDYDGDHDLFIGAIRDGAYFKGDPHIHLRDHGFHY